MTDSCSFYVKLVVVCRCGSGWNWFPHQETNQVINYHRV